MITADTETAGLFGPLRIIGWYDGSTYKVSTKASDFWNDVRFREDVVYFHNLEFDLAKLYHKTDMEIDLANSLVINRKIVRARFKNAKVELADSMALLNSSLDDLCKSFKLEKEVAKINLDEIWRQGGYKSLDDYFCRVPVKDKQYREYLRHDVLALYELLEILMRYSGFTQEDFVKIPTAASLAMHFFQQAYPEAYDSISKTKLSMANHDWFRESYIGARTNRFRMRIQNGYHYDVTGLYPYVMEKYSYPSGYAITGEGPKAERLWKSFRQNLYSHALINASVTVPPQYVPPLPMRHDSGRLLFPCGSFTGSFVGAELEMAIRRGSVKVEKVFKVSVWSQSARYFEAFAHLIGIKKATTTGAEREFWKLLGNSLYGKFGMNLRRTTYSDTLIPNGTEFFLFDDYSQKYWEYEKRVFAPYVQPQIAAHITAYARMELYKYLSYAESHGGVWYCDTDSVVTQNPLPPSWIHPTRQGKLKLEREVLEGVYIQPKLYAERGSDGKELLKSKGLVRDFRKSVTYQFYEDLLTEFENGTTEVELYKDVPIRKHFFTAMKNNEDEDTPTLTRKKANRDVPSNRIPDWKHGDSLPVSLP